MSAQIMQLLPYSIRVDGQYTQGACKTIEDACKELINVINNLDAWQYVEISDSGLIIAKVSFSRIGKNVLWYRKRYAKDVAHLIRLCAL